MTASKTIADAKRLIAAKSFEGMRALGAGVSRPCSQVRYNNAATIALSDPEAGFTRPERELITSHIVADSDESRDSILPQVRVTEQEREAVEFAAREAGLSLGAYIRKRLDLD